MHLFAHTPVFLVLLLISSHVNMCASFFVHLSGTVCPRDDNTSLFDIKRSELPNNGHSIGKEYKLGLLVTNTK